MSVGTTPGAVSAGEGAVWAVDLDGQMISRVDPSLAEVRHVRHGLDAHRSGRRGGRRVGGRGRHRCEGAQNTGPVGTTLARVDPDTPDGARPDPSAADGGAATELTEDHVAVERDAVWAIAPDFAVVRVDPRTNRIVATIRGLQAQRGRRRRRRRVGARPRRHDRADRPGLQPHRGARPHPRFGSRVTGGGRGRRVGERPGDGTVWRVQPGPRLVMRTIESGPASATWRSGRDRFGRQPPARHAHSHRPRGRTA